MNLKRTSVYLLMIAIFIVVAVLGLFLMRLLSGPEDLWLCDKGVWVKHGQPRGPEPKTLCTTTSTILTFNKVGNLTQATNKAWYLVYEEPGAPALSVKLMLSQECTMTNEKITCDYYDFKIGDRVNATGIVDNGNLENFNLIPVKD